MSTSFSDIKIFRLDTSKGGNLLARGSVVIADAVRVNFSILNGSNGRFVQLPSEKSNKIDEATGKNKYFPLAAMVSRDLQDELNKAVLAEFEKGSSGSKSAPSSTASKKSSRDGIPF